MTVKEFSATCKRPSSVWSVRKRYEAIKRHTRAKKRKGGRGWFVSKLTYNVRKLT